ncbi:MAG: ABC transporter permease [Actinoallomurus sp.]
MWIAPERRRAGRWIAPALAIAAGVALGATETARGHLTTGLVGLAVLFGYGALLAYRRGESVLTVHEAFGSGRRSGIHLRAAAMTGDVLVGVIVAAMLVQALRGAEIGLLAGLAAVAGVTYFLSILMLNRSY